MSRKNSTDSDLPTLENRVDKLESRVECLRQGHAYTVMLAPSEPVCGICGWIGRAGDIECTRRCGRCGESSRKRFNVREAAGRKRLLDWTLEQLGEGKRDGQAIK